MIYAGIGSRQTPHDACDDMNRIARRLGIVGHTLRSGGARGADTAFELGARAVGSPIEIFSPSDSACNPAWFAHAGGFHPNWNACSDFAKASYARNSAIMLGASLLEPVDCVICWTSGGAITGGTGQALRIAAVYKIPVINLVVMQVPTDIVAWVNAQ